MTFNQFQEHLNGRRAVLDNPLIINSSDKLLKHFMLVLYRRHTHYAHGMISGIITILRKRRERNEINGFKAKEFQRYKVL